MGCQNSIGQKQHKFGNIHFSGACNRSCYFCIGQWMMNLDQLNNLSEWPLKGIEGFVSSCNIKSITEVNLTGTNTDPCLYNFIPELKTYLKQNMDLKIFGIRTNGSVELDWKLFDQISLSIHGVSPFVYKKMMGKGELPNIKKIVLNSSCPVRVNFLLSPFNLCDLTNSLKHFKESGVESVNLREPYGMPFVGNPFANLYPDGFLYDMPYYNIDGLKVVYWDVNFCGVDSINLYADGHISESYPITKGCVPNDKGFVLPPEFSGDHLRKNQQWIKNK